MGQGQGPETSTLPTEGRLLVLVWDQVKLPMARPDDDTSDKGDSTSSGTGTDDIDDDDSNKDKDEDKDTKDPELHVLGIPRLPAPSMFTPGDTNPWL